LIASGCVGYNTSLLNLLKKKLAKVDIALPISRREIVHKHATFHTKITTTFSKRLYDLLYNGLKILTSKEPQIPHVYYSLTNENPHQSLYTTLLTNNECPLFREVVFRNLEVQRRRPLPYTSRYIVVRAVARTEPSSKVTRFANGHASQMCADT
jgi:hypothetical protein